MRIINLSCEILENMPIFPNDPSPQISKVLSPPDSSCMVSQITLGSHTGTHCDAPLHFIADGKGVAELPLEHFVGDCNIVDIQIRNNEISTSLLEEKLENIDCEKILILRTGFDLKFGTAEYYSEIPCFSSDISGILKSHGIITLGLDFPSIEYTNKNSISAHNDLLGNGIVIIEGLVNLSEISKSRVFFSAPPLNISKCDGCPVRAYVII